MSRRALVTIALAALLSNDALAARPRVKGYVLTHEHPTVAMSFGGNYAFTGAKGNLTDGIMKKGYTAHCGGCKILGNCDHGEVKGGLVGPTDSLGGDLGVHASHMGPVHDSNSHIRYRTEWIKEAFRPSEPEFQDARMRIMVAFAMDNEAMCEQLYYANKGHGGAGGKGHPCSKGDSLQSLKRQIGNIKAWARKNASWMRIAYSAKDVRDIVESDKLAVIIGIEADYAFGAEDRTFDPVQRLNRYYDLGVRTFYLAHKINSRLSGADIFLPKGNLGGKAVRATQAISGCFYYDDNVGQFPLNGSTNNNLCDNKCGDNAFKGGGPLGGVLNQCNFKFSEISEPNMLGYIAQGSGAFNGFNIYPKPPGFTGYSDPKMPPSFWRGSRMDGDVERNNLGLSHDGERVVREAMTKGMIVNIDHVSSIARAQIYDLSTKEFGGYPLNALHNKPNAMLSHKAKFKRHEYDFDTNELKFVSGTGGFFGLRMGPTDSKPYAKSGVRDHCPRTSTESAKMLAWLIDQGLSVGYSLDFATLTEGVHSRTMTKCALRENGDDRLHSYDGHVTEGLSHVGVMKKWHRELEAVGLKDRYLEQLRNDGVEQFIAMWERSEAKASVGKQIPRKTFDKPVSEGKCREDSDCADNAYCAFAGADPRNNKCKAKKTRGKICTTQRQCRSGRCAWGICADPDECRKDADCTSKQFCGDPISGKRTCKTLKSHGQGCTKAAQCATGRCAWGFCADADECRKDADCNKSEFCGDPISGKRSCKALKKHGQGCTKAAQCATGRCSWGSCADADECRSHGDCKKREFCGDPISGKRKCKALKKKGALCTKKMQCASDKCFLGRCK
ncbi:MAG: Dickkopf N-terminal cysteine-rich domain-containing protein [Deltaproteobacteria bacterium]